MLKETAQIDKSGDKQREKCSHYNKLQVTKKRQGERRKRAKRKQNREERKLRNSELSCQLQIEIKEREKKREREREKKAVKKIPFNNGKNQLTC